MTADLPMCACGHYLAIHGPRGCVAASGCVCRRNGMSLPLIATTTGGRTADRYCSACLSLWQRWSTDDKRALMHPACRDALQAIYSTPAQEAAS